MSEPFTLTVYEGTVNASTLRETVALYDEIYSEPPYLETQEDSAKFNEDLPKRIRQTSGRLVIARLGSEPLGFALGHQLPPTTRWWEGAVESLPTQITAEYLGRTFAVIEIAVRSPHRRHGLGRRLHAHLSTDLSEERQALLVRPEATAAQAAYRQWRYQKVGQIRPLRDAPIYDAMLLNR